MYAFVDVETTGLRAGWHEITEAAVIVADRDLRVVSELSLIVRPDHPERLDSVAAKITGYDPDVTRPGEISSELAARLLAITLDKKVFCGHNVTFDIDHVRALLESHGLAPGWWRKGRICTYALSAPLVAARRVHRQSLEALCKNLGIELGDEAHHAMPDARASLEIARRLMPPFTRVARRL